MLEIKLSFYKICCILFTVMFLSKKIGMSLVCLGSLLFSGCTEKVIPLTIWVDSGNVPVIQKRLDEFAQINSKNKKFNFKIIEQSSANCRNVLLDGNVELPDVFVFIDNQLNELYDKGFLKEITYEKDRVITECGGPESGVVKASMKDGKLMAYPELNSNGYFMYYNKAYFKPEDLNSFERIADVAYSQGKKVSMDLQNGWYLYSFFLDGLSEQLRPLARAVRAHIGDRGAFSVNVPRAFELIGRGRAAPKEIVFEHGLSPYAPYCCIKLRIAPNMLHSFR